MRPECTRRLGLALFTLRKVAKESPTSIAESVGLSTNDYLMIESGRAPLPLPLLSRICDHLDSSLTELFALVEVQFPEHPGSTERLELWTILKNYLAYEAMRCKGELVRKAVRQYGDAIFANDYRSFAKAPIAIGELQEGRLCSWSNDTGLAFWGEDVVGRDPDEISLDDRNKMKMDNILKSVLQGQLTIAYNETIVRVGAGQLFAIGVLALPKVSRLGRITGVTVMSVDISHEKRTQIEAQQLLEQPEFMLPQAQ